MEAETGRIGTPEIDTINAMVDKLIGGYSLMSKAFMARELAELKTRIDKAGYEYGKLRSRVESLEERPTKKEVETMILAAKTELRSER